MPYLYADIAPFVSLGRMPIATSFLKPVQISS